MTQGIGWAVEQLQNGNVVRRAGWNGRNMWLMLVPSGAAHFAEKVGAGYPVHPFVLMKTADDTIVPWLCSQTDLLATDWEIAH